jgi:hypothetical protein
MENIQKRVVGVLLLPLLLLLLLQKRKIEKRDEMILLLLLLLQVSPRFLSFLPPLLVGTIRQDNQLSPHPPHRAQAQGLSQGLHQEAPQQEGEERHLFLLEGQIA